MIRLPNYFVPERSWSPSRGSKVFAVVATAILVVSSAALTATGLAGSTGALPGSTSHAAHVYNSYTATRSFALLAALLWCVVARRWRGAALMLALNGLVQLLDAAIGVWQHDLAKTLGPACFAALLAVAAWLLLRRDGEEHGGEPGEEHGARWQERLTVGPSDGQAEATNPRAAKPER
jgi:hypothetical protein